jgi:hypothetical protein
MYFLGLITRCKDEFFINEFCNYYIDQGVDKIYILDDNSNDKSIYNNITNPKVIIIYSNNIISNNYASTIYKQNKDNFKWLIYVDVDEFIVTSKNMNNTIRYELENEFNDVDCIKIPWVIMSCNGIDKNPSSILLENTYRWNHDLTHNHNIKKFRCRYQEIEVKCIFKTAKFEDIIDHNPINPINNVKIVDGIRKKKQELKTNYKKLRENDISEGFLLCYHYRIISIQNCINKLKNNFWYINDQYTLNQLLDTDYNEVKDELLVYKIQSINIKKYFSNFNKKYFLGLLTRCKDEFMVKEFCDYYIKQGVQKIIILDDNSSDTSIYDNIDNNIVTVYYAKNNSKCHEFECDIKCTCNRVLADMIYQQIKENFEWLIYIDIDEFIATRKNESMTIYQEILNTYHNTDTICIMIPWIIMLPYGDTNPKSVLNTNIYRINYDNKPIIKLESGKKYIGSGKFNCQYTGHQIQCKSIFKCEYFDRIHDINNPNDHHPLYQNTNYYHWIESLCNNLIPKYTKELPHNYVTEDKIKNGYFVCYHYRIVSKEHAIQKLKSNNWYIQFNYTLDNMIKTFDNNNIIDTRMKYIYPNNILKYVHITKTSGTYIEDLGFYKGFLWGRFDDKLNYLKGKYSRKGISTFSHWHEPIIYLNEKPYSENTKLFTIVRNPYKRIISECLCEWGGILASKMETVDDLNIYIKEQILSIDLENLRHHFLPQYLYTHKNQRQMIDYIIKYEEIHKFNDLMQQYDLDIEYIPKSTELKFSVNDISKENIKLINEIYHLDFVCFNYNKILI